MDNIVEKAIESICRILDRYDHQGELKVVVNAVYNAAKGKGFCEGYEQGINDANDGKDQRVVAHLN